MVKGKKTKQGKSAKAAKIKKNPLFEKTPRSFRIGGDIQPKRDLTRFVRWPKYIRLQRQKRILLQRLKVPPAIHQFSHTIERNQASTLLKLLKNYQPETAHKRHEREKEEAKAKVEKREASIKKPTHEVEFGLNNVTRLIEEKKAKLVVIANDVDPIETVVWLPQLCRKQEIPFCFIKNKARLGTLVHQHTATCVAITGVKKEHQSELDTLIKNFRAQYNENVDLRKNWGGGVLGHKANLAKEVKLKAIEAEQIKKSAM